MREQGQGAWLLRRHRHTSFWTVSPSSEESPFRELRTAIAIQQGRAANPVFGMIILTARSFSRCSWLSSLKKRRKGAIIFFVLFEWRLMGGRKVLRNCFLGLVSLGAQECVLW